MNDLDLLHVKTTTRGEQHPNTLPGDRLDAARMVTRQGHPVMLPGEQVAPTKRHDISKR